MAAEAPWCAAFVQARMSSSRFPGKVLAPYQGRPIIEHVVEAARVALGPAASVVVVTSDDRSDDPLAVYLRHLGQPFFRGSLHDVFGRFRAAVEGHPCEWVLRLSGDSPAIDPAVIRAVCDRAVAEPDADIVTTTFTRTFARGNNAEIVRRRTLAGTDARALDDEDREHVTRYYYRHPERYRIVNVDSADRSLADHTLAVDTVDDLIRLEGLSRDELALRRGRPSGAGPVAR